MGERDWAAWHAPYDEPGSPLHRRLGIVQARIRAAIDDAPPGPITAISLCAGQGRDILPVLAAHRRGHDVRARLVERDERIVDVARASVAELGLEHVDVVTD